MGEATFAYNNNRYVYDLYELPVAQITISSKDIYTTQSHVVGVLDVRRSRGVPNDIDTVLPGHYERIFMTSYKIIQNHADKVIPSLGAGDKLEEKYPADK